MLKRSIRNKLIVLLMITTIVPFGSSILITYLYTKGSLEDQVVKESSNLLYQGKINLESYLNELNGLTLSLYNNPDFINYLRSPDEKNDYQNVGIVKNVMQTILYTGDTINEVKISYAKDDRVISATKRSTVVFSTSIEDKKNEAFNSAERSPYNMYIEPIYASHENSARRGRDIIMMHRALTNVPGSDVLGYITLGISPDTIIDMSRNLYNRESEEFFLLSSEGEMIYSSNEEITDRQNDQKWIESIMKADSTSGTLEWKENSFNGVMMYDRLSDSSGGWILVKRVPYHILYDSAYSVAKINILFGVIGLSLVVLAVLFVSFKITSPIRILLQNIEQVEKGNMKIASQSFGSDEIGILGSRFQQMIERINQLITREYKLELENKTNQIKVLQSQINPHFLYNALQSIGTVALKNKVPQIYSLITHLSKIMRYGMNMEEDLVPLSKEITYTNAFLLLQKERFGDHLHYHVEVEQNVQHILVPKMILQPIIENYFKHGFDIREGIGSIELKCYRDENELVLRITDNGFGVTPQRLNEIYEHFRADALNKKGPKTNIGLKNVYSRLKLYYDHKAKLFLENKEEGGFMVTMRLPVQLEGEKNEGHHN
ncbi:cache domain-containing sensor histidine kinase [Peribacillus frigoritolerans]|uniref:cache domain-containing sensor histidine kinase n=1 Tax=Peribacillus frigoritolerans TaxID=450367 RepID=UPI0010597C4F|nr:sensor histidine kinase [Peribacillus frigoritolerans]TDL80953.1 sensor histidine kinase [Peribacillus frigoritolerans]